MSYYPSTTTDLLCRDCAHMRLADDGGRWCWAPQLVKLQGRGTRCVFERDTYPEPHRSHDNGTGKCGPGFMNFKRREAV